MKEKEITLLCSDMKEIIWESLMEQLGLPEDTDTVDLVVEVKDHTTY